MRPIIAILQLNSPGAQCRRGFVRILVFLTLLCGMASAQEPVRRLVLALMGIEVHE